MTESIKKTIEFIKEQFLNSNDYEDFNYRYNHTIRTAAIGQKIAKAEGLDEEGLIIACLLHDIGYIACKTDEDYDLHGRISEKIARDFLESIEFDEKRIETICYGIRIHTEEPEREPSAFELSVQDADNIDRFDAYRLYLNLQNFKIGDLDPKGLIECANLRIERYNKYVNIKCGTNTATNLWVDKISFQLEYFNRLKRQMEEMDRFGEELGVNISSEL